MELSAPLHRTFEEWMGCELARLSEAAKVTEDTSENPSCEQATMVSTASHPSLQMVPHCELKYISRKPVLMECPPPTSLKAPLVRAVKGVDIGGAEDQ